MVRCVRFWPGFPGGPGAADRLSSCSSCPAALSTAFAAAPSHIPSDPLLARSTPRRARGPILIFRKIHLYGETKKSTHGHTTAQPTCTHCRHSARDARPRQQSRLRIFPGATASRAAPQGALQGSYRVGHIPPTLYHCHGGPTIPRMLHGAGQLQCSAAAGYFEPCLPCSAL